MSLNEMDAHGLGTPAAAAKEEEPAQEVVERRNQSKYDFVKVRVWVEDHVYVLSRYLVSRALVGTKVQYCAVAACLDACLELQSEAHEECRS